MRRATTTLAQEVAPALEQKRFGSAVDQVTIIVVAYREEG
jgi:hypothetical protein